MDMETIEAKLDKGNEDAEMSELTETEETPKPTRKLNNALRRTG